LIHLLNDHVYLEWVSLLCCIAADATHMFSVKELALGYFGVLYNLPNVHMHTFDVTHHVVLRRRRVLAVVTLKQKRLALMISG
jgi:hypothetical protein